jgi:hypothetical protein
MPQMAFQSNDERWPRTSTETRFAASPITSGFRITASCNCSEFLSASLPAAMERMRPTTFQNVVLVQPVVLHNCVASRRILSRTYQWNEFSVPT